MTEENLKLAKSYEQKILEAEKILTSSQLETFAISFISATGKENICCRDKNIIEAFQKIIIQLNKFKLEELKQKLNNL